MSADNSLDTATRHDQHGQWPQAETVDDFRHNLATVHARIAAACERAGRDPASVRLLPVSKTKPEAVLRLAYAAGCRMLGENKPQEAHRKWEAMADLGDLRWSVIGHLQTNKAKLVAQCASEFQALDSLRVAEALERRLQAEGRALDVFVQVNTSGEASKYGLAPEDVPQGISLDELSMGMSGDYEIAIEEGATVVRVGQAIFGARPMPDSYYWPSAGADDAKAGEAH